MTIKLNEPRTDGSSARTGHLAGAETIVKVREHWAAHCQLFNASHLIRKVINSAKSASQGRVEGSTVLIAYVDLALANWTNCQWWNCSH